MRYHIADFYLDTDQFELSKSGNSIHLEPQALELLVLLVTKRNQVVSKEEINKEIWKGRIVSESALSSRIKMIRQVLGDDGRTQKFVRTIHKKGFRFVADVEEIRAENTDEIAPASGVLSPLEVLDRLPPPGKPSIAVLAFKNVSDDPEEAYFSDGVSDGIINGLTRYRDLFVMGRYSAFSFRDKIIGISKIGKKLGVQYVVQGTVRRHDERVRITAELVDAVTGQILWAERYDRELKDMFAVEDEVSTTIVATLVTRVEDSAYKHSQNRSPENLAAYDWVLKGNRLLELGGKNDLLEARHMYEKAIDLEPAYSAAYTGLSATYLFEHWSLFAEDFDEVLNRSLKYGQKAVALDDKDHMAHHAVGHSYFCLGRHKEAEFHIEKALALNPGEYHNVCFKGYVLACTGRHDESRLCLVDALRQNPLAPDGCLCALAMSDYLARRYEDATVMLTRLSSDLLRKFSCLAASYAQLGRDSEARAAVEEFRNLLEPELVSALGDDNARWRDYWTRMYSIFTPEDLEHLHEGLRKAGLPA